YLFESRHPYLTSSVCYIFSQCPPNHSNLNSFPTRRSSDLFQGYLNIYNNYFKAPWMPDRTEANPNELNQDDARYGFRCCHHLDRSEERFSRNAETDLVCRLLLENKNIRNEDEVRAIY